ncbi:pre-mRNA splicing factor CLF1 [Phlyctema vagabunda]|uniref:Pre-mRNA splicing factor CLF1 n=1 Tax=Phlyctema vagabunda TaxID=108571 RepID=A0ABR4P7D9_9HELO
MVLPAPIAPIVDACSVIFNNTLYSYSSNIFQCLPMEEGGIWSQLPMGEAVTGGVCVKSTPKNNTDAAALYIVGGTSANSTDYLGFQRFTFGTGEWESIKPSVPVTQNRLYHNAVYLNASDSILLYAGTQDGNMAASSQTFTIDAFEPFNVLAYQANAPPAINPLVMQWTNSKAVYIGGSEDNRKVMEFSPSRSWVDTNITLRDPISNISTVKSVVVNGNDGSRSLYTFDMTVAPNKVNRTLLIDASKNPIQDAAPIVARGLGGDISESDGELEKRGNLTASNWPAYNDSLAPMSTRTQYSIAMDQSKHVVISGGNTDDVLCIFKGRDNCWQNATAVLASKQVSTIQGGLGTPVETSPSTASSAAAASSSAASTEPAATPFPVKVLGAVLGSIAGVALILLAILLLFRWRRKQQQFGTHDGHSRGMNSHSYEKNDMDIGYSEKDMAPMPSPSRYGHRQKESQGSFSSMTMLLGRVGHNRGASKGMASIRSESSSQFNKNYKTAISNPIPQESYPVLAPPTLVAASLPPVATVEREEKTASVVQDRSIRRPRASGAGKRGSTRRSSGWNRYWSGGSALNILGFGSKRSTYDDGASDIDSQYTEDRRPSVITQHSAMPPPLRIPGQPEINRVASGSPRLATAPDQFAIREGVSGQIDHSDSRSSTSTYHDRHDAFSSGIPESFVEPYSGIGRPDWGTDRVPSDAYTNSVYGATLPRGTGSPFPQESRFVAPAPPPQQQQQQWRQPQTSSDMSWLNLGADSRI